MKNITVTKTMNTEKAKEIVATATETLKTKKTALASAKKVFTLAARTDAKAQRIVLLNHDNTVAAKAATMSSKALDKATEAVTKATEAVTKATDTLNNTKATLAEAKAAAKASKVTEPNNNPERNALVHSVAIDAALCEKAGVPIRCVNKPTLFVQEYAHTFWDDDKGILTEERKVIAKTLVEFGLTKNTAQTQITYYLNGRHPKNFNGTADLEKAAKAEAEAEAFVKKASDVPVATKTKTKAKGKKKTPATEVEVEA